MMPMRGVNFAMSRIEAKPSRKTVFLTEERFTSPKETIPLSSDFVRSFVSVNLPHLGMILRRIEVVSVSDVHCTFNQTYA